MNGVWIITTGKCNKVVGCTDAPHNTPAQTICENFAGSVGIPKSQHQLFQASWTPVIKWKNELEDVWTPYSERKIA